MTNSIGLSLLPVLACAIGVYKLPQIRGYRSTQLHYRLMRVFCEGRRGSFHFANAVVVVFSPASWLGHRQLRATLCLPVIVVMTHLLAAVDGASTLSWTTRSARPAAGKQSSRAPRLSQGGLYTGLLGLRRRDRDPTPVQSINQSIRNF